MEAENSLGQHKHNLHKETLLGLHFYTSRKFSGSSDPASPGWLQGIATPRSSIARHKSSNRIIELVDSSGVTHSNPSALKRVVIDYFQSLFSAEPIAPSDPISSVTLQNSSVVLSLLMKSKRLSFLFLERKRLGQMDSPLKDFWDIMKLDLLWRLRCRSGLNPHTYIL